MQELTGGIKNALERGEDINKIKQSFINAGYSQRDVDSSVAEIQSQSTQQPQAHPQENLPQKAPPKSLSPTPNRLPSQLRKLPQQTPKKQQPQRFPVWLIVVIILSVLILIGAALLGFYWDKLFNILPLIF